MNGTTTWTSLFFFRILLASYFVSLGCVKVLDREFPVGIHFLGVSSALAVIASAHARYTYLDGIFGDKETAKKRVIKELIIG